MGKDRKEEREWVSLELEGVEFYGQLHKPLTVKPPWPAVLFLHGFAGNKIGRTRQYVEAAELLAERGIASFRIDYRGCGDSQGSFVDMRFSTHIEDALEALNYLMSREDIDKEHLGLMGRSLGGPIAVQVAARSQNIHSMALWAPVSNSEKWRREWEAFCSMPGGEEIIYLNDIPFSRDFLKRFFSEFFQSEPANALSDLGHIPLMHVHAELDTVVPAEHMHEYKNYRKEAASESYFLRLPNCDHQFYHPIDQAHLVKETQQWFVKTLLKG